MDSSRRQPRLPPPSEPCPHLQPSPRSNPSLRPQSPTLLRKRPRPASLVSQPHLQLSTTTEPLAKAAPRTSHPPPPRTYDATIQQFTSFAPRTPQEKLAAVRLPCGAPRLSNMALAAARVHCSRGLVRDLSRVADDHVYLLLATPTLTPTLVASLEECNPKRVGVFEALWARIVKDKFEMSELPDGVVWWRTFYERLTMRRELDIQRSSERLRMWYSDGDRKRKERAMETTRRIRVRGPADERRRRRGGGNGSAGLSRIARLRQEFRRDKNRR